MPSRLDRSVWTKVKRDPPGLSIQEFESALAAGVDPWVSYKVDGRQVSLLSLLCSGSHVDRSVMLSSWLRHVGHPDNDPSGIPALHHIPEHCSMNAFDGLIKAGADGVAKNKKGQTPLVAFVENVYLRHGGIEDWNTIRALQALSGERLSDIMLRDANGKNVDILLASWLPIASNYMQQEEIEFLLSAGEWSFPWKEELEEGKRRPLFKNIAFYENPRMWTRAGFDWAGKDRQGDTFFHVLDRYSQRYDCEGNLILPVDAICEAIDQGADLDAKGLGGWSMQERINAVSWSPSSGDIGKIVSRQQAKRLSGNTPALTAAREKTRRI